MAHSAEGIAYMKAPNPKHQISNESPRRKQRGIKDQNRKKHSPQAAGYLPEQK